MADAFEGWHWFAELDYNADFFAKNTPQLRREMGFLYSFGDQKHFERVLDCLEGALEHAGELTHALNRLKEIVNAKRTEQRH